jgi:hypothetical protein
MKPNEIAAIVLDVDPLKTRSCSTICKKKAAQMEKICFTNAKNREKLLSKSFKAATNSLKLSLILFLELHQFRLVIRNSLPVHADCRCWKMTNFRFVIVETFASRLIKLK